METIIFFCFPLFFAIYALTQLILHKLRNLPSSPFPTLPLIGHLHLLKTPFHRALFKLSDRYGPVMLLQFGCRRVVVVTSPSAAEECFTTNDVVFANRPRLLIGKHLGYNYTSLAWSPYGNHWRNLRRIATVEILCSHRLQLLAHIRADEIRALIRQIFRVSQEDPGRAQDLKSLLFQLAFNVMMRMIAVKRYYGDEVELSEEVKMFQEIVSETSLLGGAKSSGDFLPFLRCFGIRQTEKRFIALHEKRDKFMQDLIDQHREMEPGDSSGERKRTMIEILLSLRETEPEYYTDERIKSLMLVLSQAGSETTALTMEWVMSNLLNNPRVLKKAQSEIDDLVVQDRLIDESDVAKLPYLRWVINETMRMQPVAPLLLPHESSAECTISGFRIPRGTMLMVNAWAIQNDPRIWEEPGKFWPERFQGLEGSKDRFKLMPFGSGRRACPGEGLAMRVMGLALGSLIQCFDWERVSDDLVDMSAGTGITSHKAQPLVAKCRIRPEMMQLLSGIGTKSDP
ncbi:hypothetical protein NMG60_11016497 [Bertholletia excelsa]